jgi:hypothetical protein
MSAEFIRGNAGVLATHLLHREAPERQLELRRALRSALAQVNATVIGQAVAFGSLRPMVGRIRELFLEHLARMEAESPEVVEENPPFSTRRPGGLRDEHREDLAELDLLCAWPEDEDDLELALRFESVGSALLNAVLRRERARAFPEIMREDLNANDPFGC